MNYYCGGLRNAIETWDLVNKTRPSWENQKPKKLAYVFGSASYINFCFGKPNCFEVIDRLNQPETDENTT